MFNRQYWEYRGSKPNKGERDPNLSKPRHGVRVNPGFDAKEDTPLDKINTLLADQPKPRRLHPTKGFRKLSARRERAAFVVADIMKGGHWPLDRTHHFVVEGY